MRAHALRHPLSHTPLVAIALLYICTYVTLQLLALHYTHLRMSLKAEISQILSHSHPTTFSPFYNTPLYAHFICHTPLCATVIAFLQILFRIS